MISVPRPFPWKLVVGSGVICGVCLTGAYQLMEWLWHRNPWNRTEFAESALVEIVVGVGFAGLAVVLDTEERSPAEVGLTLGTVLGIGQALGLLVDPARRTPQGWVTAALVMLSAGVLGTIVATLRRR